MAKMTKNTLEFPYSRTVGPVVGAFFAGDAAVAPQSVAVAVGSGSAAAAVINHALAYADATATAG